jgi:hypothetical protein
VYIPFDWPMRATPGRGADGEQAAPYPRRQGHQQPLALGHIGLHTQHREHHRDIVDDGGEMPIRIFAVVGPRSI